MYEDLTHSLEELRAMARAGNARPIGETESGEFIGPVGGLGPCVPPAPRISYMDDECYMELFLGEENLDVDQRLADGFQMLGAD
jgi:hypothetical protein